MESPAAEVIQRWSTELVAPASRLDYFAAALSQVILPISLDNANQLDFFAEMSFANLDSIGICKMSGSPHTAIRGPKELALTTEHRINLVMALNCSWSADHRGLLQFLPGDILIHDSQYPIQADIRSAFVGINISVSSIWLRRWLPFPGSWSGKRIIGQSPWGRALSSYVASMSPDLVAAPPLPLSVLSDQLGSLLALTASVCRENPPLEYTSAVRSLRDRILDCIAQRCTEINLTATDVADSLNISRRTLHRTLAAASETFGGKLIDARVRTAERMLSSPLFNRVTTAEIGRRAGFLSASHFVRVVRKCTGRTPLQLRHSQK